MTKAKISAALQKLADDMQEIAVAMDYYGGLNAEFQQHSKELLGASYMAREWAYEVIA